jgi:lysophospholipase L1-like esterase
MYASELNLRLSPIIENQDFVICNQKIWFLGDSRISQWNIPDSILSKLEYCNLGIDGQTTAQVLLRLNIYLSTHVPEYMFLQVGINDLKAIGLFPKRNKQIVEQCIKNIELILYETLKRGVTPVFISIIPPGEVEWLRLPIWSNNINLAVISVNKEIINYAKIQNIAVIDAYGVLSEDGFRIKKDFQKNCLHMNTQGYDVLNEELQRYMLRTRK